MTNLSQTAQNYQHMLAVANGSRQMQVADQPHGYRPYQGRTLQEFLDYGNQVFTNLDASYARGAQVSSPTGRRNLSMVNGMTGGSYTNANDAKADFELMRVASQRPPFNGDVNAYMTSLIAFSQAHPNLANQNLSLDTLNSSNFFSWSEQRMRTPSAEATGGAPRPAEAAAAPAPANGAAPPAAPTFTPALNTALTNFLTGNATEDEIKALQTATGNPATGRLDREGNLPNATYHGAETLKDAREALGGRLSPTNHPDLYNLATNRFHQMTGLPLDREPNAEEIRRADERIANMSHAERAEYQSLVFLLGGNDVPLRNPQANGAINVDGYQGPLTIDSRQATQQIIRSNSATVTNDVTLGNAENAQPAPTQPRVVILDMSGESSRGDRERLLHRGPALLEENLNRNGGNFRVVVFNPAADRDGPQDLASFARTQPNAVGVIQLKEDGIRGGRQFAISSVSDAVNGVPNVNSLVVTNRTLNNDSEYNTALGSAAEDLTRRINGNPARETAVSAGNATITNITNGTTTTGTQLVAPDLSRTQVAQANNAEGRVTTSGEFNRVAQGTSNEITRQDLVFRNDTQNGPAVRTLEYNHSNQPLGPAVTLL